MSDDRQESGQRLVPYLIYQDGRAAIDFLCRAFGFEESERHEMPDGRLGHAELEYEGHRLMLASEYPELGLVSPRRKSEYHAQLVCYVDDLDAHHQRAKDAGATIISEPDVQYGERTYRAADLEGVRWIFTERGE